MFNADITCQSKNSEVDTLSCEWNKSAWAQVRFLYRYDHNNSSSIFYSSQIVGLTDAKDLTFCYRRYTSICETISKMEGAEENMSLVKECPSGVGDHKECNLSNISLFSCYKIWLEVEGGRGKVRSFPVYVAPIDCGEFQSCCFLF